MKMNLKKALAVGMVAVITSVSLAGCGKEDPNKSTKYPQLDGTSRDELIDKLMEYNTKNSELQTEVDNLQAALNGLTESQSSTPSEVISSVGDGTNRMTFNTIDSKIIFPESFAYPSSVAPKGDTYINVAGVKMKFNSNWVVKMNGNCVEVQYDDGIVGTIKVSDSTMILHYDAILNDVMKPWFEGLPNPQATYKKITLNSEDVGSGVHAETPTTIDSDTAYLHCGMIHNDPNDKTVTYVFVYRNASGSDVAKNDIIKNVISSIEFSDIAKVTISDN